MRRRTKRDVAKTAVSLSKLKLNICLFCYYW